MARRDIIVVGGSAGGIEALLRVLSTLPADLPAAICVTIHQAAYAPNRRPAILSRAGHLPVVSAEQGMRLQPGTVYLAVPDHHLYVERAGDSDHGVLRLARGPKENRSRPAIDPLFRSAALAFGPRVIGVMLSGALDDGVSGLWVIKDRGGMAVVQDPVDALVSSMPAHAIEESLADHILPASGMGALLGDLTRAPLRVQPPQDPGNPMVQQSGRSTGQRQHADIEQEHAISKMKEDAHQSSDRPGIPSRFACPDCGGVLWSAHSHGAPLHFRCETGHAYNAAALAEGQTEAVEGAMWAAVRALEDKAALARVRADYARDRGQASQVQRFEIQERSAQEHASAIRDLLRVDGEGSIRPAVMENEREPGEDEGGDRPTFARSASPV
jgi:two-component system chemotaxis response regulator CheB